MLAFLIIAFQFHLSCLANIYFRGQGALSMDHHILKSVLTTVKSALKSK